MTCAVYMIIQLITSNEQRNAQLQAYQKQQQQTTNMDCNILPFDCYGICAVVWFFALFGYPLPKYQTKKKN